MGSLSKTLRSVAGGQVGFWCPGCKCMHAVKVEGDQAWTWNKDVDKPTFSPSILVRSGHFEPWSPAGSSCWCTYYQERPNEEKLFGCTQCHSFVVGGHIQFLNDCSHEFAGKTVLIPDWPTES